MRDSDRLKRAIAFYFSVTLYLTLLPIMLSFSLGYKIDFKELKIYKTGIIYINSNPTGAYVYINGKSHNNLTPTQIEELKPGTYKIEVRREGFYPWETELVVRPNMVTKADSIVLFPIAKGLKEINRYVITDFAVSDKNYIYYLTNAGLFRSGMDGSDLKRISFYSNWPKDIIDKKFSPDDNKFCYFDKEAIYIVYLNRDKSIVSDNYGAEVEKVLTSEEPIVDVFWYSGSSYVIAVTRKDIKIVEVRGGDKRNIVSLYKFNAPPQGLHYDATNDSLYFKDADKETSLIGGAHLYRLDLRQRFFDSLMKLLLNKEIEPTHGQR